MLHRLLIPLALSALACQSGSPERYAGTATITDDWSYSDWNGEEYEEVNGSEDFTKEAAISIEELHSKDMLCTGCFAFAGYDDGDLATYPLLLAKDQGSYLLEAPVTVVEDRPDFELSYDVSVLAVTRLSRQEIVLEAVMTSFYEEEDGYFYEHHVQATFHGGRVGK